MKKWLCMLMAAVLVVVMMAPMEAKASSGYVEGTDIGAPSLISESGSYIVDDEWDHVSSEEYYISGAQHPVVEYYAYKDYVQYLTIDISKLWAESGYLGYYTVLAPIDLIFNAQFNTNAGNSFSVAVHDVEFIGYNPGVTFVESVYQWSDTFDAAGTYDISQNLGSVRVTSSERINVGFDGFSNISLKIVYRVSSHSGATGVSSFAPDVQLNAAVASWGKTAFYREPLEKSWVNQILDALNGGSYNDAGNVQNSISGAADQVTQLEQAESSLTGKQDALNTYEPPELSINAVGGSSFVLSCLQSFYKGMGDFQFIITLSVFFGVIGLIVSGGKRL